MKEDNFNFGEGERYYTELAAAFVRGKLGGAGDLSSEELIEVGRARGLRLHKFKRQVELPRVQKGPTPKFKRDQWLRKGGASTHNPELSLDSK